MAFPFLYFIRSLLTYIGFQGALRLVLCLVILPPIASALYIGTTRTTGRLVETPGPKEFVAYRAFADALCFDLFESPSNRLLGVNESVSVIGLGMRA